MAGFADIAQDARQAALAALAGLLPADAIEFENDPLDALQSAHARCWVEVDSNAPAAICGSGDLGYRRRGRVVVEAWTPQGEGWGLSQRILEAFTDHFSVPQVGCLGVRGTATAPARLQPTAPSGSGDGGWYAARASVEFETAVEGPRAEAPGPFLLDLASNLESTWSGYTAAAGRYLAEVVAPLSAAPPTVIAPNLRPSLAPLERGWLWSAVTGEKLPEEIPGVSGGPRVLVGLLEVRLFQPIGSGAGALWRDLDLIDDSFRGLDLGLVETEPPTLKSLGQDGQHWSWILDIPIRAQA